MLISQRKEIMEHKRMIRYHQNAVEENRKNNAILKMEISKQSENNVLLKMDMKKIMDHISLISSMAKMTTPVTSVTDVKTMATVVSTTSENVVKKIGPLCNRCHKAHVTDQYKSDKRWKSRCNLCLSKIRTTNNKRKRSIV
jgi:glycerol-3-phosphate responsive antiterminator